MLWGGGGCDLHFQHVLCILRFTAVDGERVALWIDSPPFRYVELV